MKHTLILRPLALAISLVAASQAHAVGEGKIAFGGGSIVKNGETTTVNQLGGKMIVDWDNMNVAKNETLNFSQPLPSSAVLNRVHSPDPTSILGALNAPGRVFVVNPNGVLIGAGARINVASLVASSLDISDDDFKANNLNFRGEGKGVVKNSGTITALDYVALLGGAEVSNDATGRIGAGRGVAMASASDLTLRLGNGMDVKINKGSLNALVKNGGFIGTADGGVKLTAWAIDALTRSVVNNTGTIEATGVSRNANNEIVLNSMGNGSVDIAGKLTATAPDTRQGSTITAKGATINVLDNAELTAARLARTYYGSSYLTGGDIRFDAPDVNLNKAKLAAANLNIIADNVRTGGAEHQPVLSGAGRSTLMTSVRAASDGKNINVGAETKAVADDGLIDAGFVKAVADGKGSLFVRNAKGNLTVDNSALNYGRLSLDSDEGSIAFNSAFQGTSLTASGNNVTQAVGADINADHVELASRGDLAQNANITAKNDAFLSGRTIRQEKGTAVQARQVGLRAGDIQLNGKIKGDLVQLAAGNSVTQSADGVMDAGELRLDGRGANFSLTQGTNNVAGVTADVKALDLAVAGSTQLRRTTTQGSLKVTAADNLTVSDAVDVRENLDLKAGKDLIQQGSLSSYGNTTLDADTIRTSWAPNQYRRNAIAAGGDLTVAARNNIDLDSVYLNGKNTFTADSGSVKIGNLQGESKASTAIKAKGDIALGSVGDRASNFGSLSAQSTDGAIAVGAFKTRGDVALDAKGAVSVGNYSETSGDVSIKSGANVAAQKGISANKLTVAAIGDVVLGNSGGRDIDVTSTGGSVSTPTLWGVNVGLKAKGDINVGRITASGKADLASSEGKTKISFLDAADANVTSAGNVSIDTLRTGRDAVLAAGVDGIDLGSVETGRDLTLKTQGDIRQGRLNSSGRNGVRVGGDLTYDVAQTTKVTGANGQPMYAEVRGKVIDPRVKSDPAPTDDGTTPPPAPVDPAVAFQAALQKARLADAALQRAYEQVNNEQASARERLYQALDVATDEKSYRAAVSRYKQESQDLRTKHAELMRQVQQTRDQAWKEANVLRQQMLASMDNNRGQYGYNGYGNRNGYGYGFM
ncbi:filamentous hemagglutinin N-terminal domain-containing protein [Paraburkholderia bonniea]|uniref:two-partner secretion domain-containing protein n=1 Tax=Paraburkholderia bonniea TaxID=2152891 RepID=UPI0012913C21|nr:filamentous hemagglutinin N-terminal domain-containing protein [Paraburkholderia bonniea]